MAKHTLSVCKICHLASEERPENQPADGTLLYEQLVTLCDQQFPSEQFEIQSTQCLWACDHGCVAAISSPEKSTYLFVDLCVEESPRLLVEFIKMYISSNKGAIAWKNIPEPLQPTIFAQIPPTTNTHTNSA